MSTPADWIEHRRPDGERLGWMRPVGDLFVVIDLLGRARTGPLEWLEAEETLDALGIGYLADPYELRVGDEWRRVRMLEVSTRAIRVKDEDWGDMTAPTTEHSLPFPMPETLRPYQG